MALKISHEYLDIQQVMPMPKERFMLKTNKPKNMERP